MDRVDACAVHLADVRAVDQDERDDPPEDHRLRYPADSEGGRAEPEHRDHEDRRDAAKEIGVDDRECAERKEDRPGKAAKHREEQREHEDQHLGDAEDLHVEQECARNLGERGLELGPAEELPVNLGPTRGVRYRNRDDDEEHRGAEKCNSHAPAAVAAGAQASDQARTTREVYFKIGAPVAFASHVCWSFFNVPLARSDVIAVFTHATSGLPFCRTTPKRSVVCPAAFSNWPRILLFGTCTAVT